MKTVRADIYIRSNGKYHSMLQAHITKGKKIPLNASCFGIAKENILYIAGLSGIKPQNTANRRFSRVFDFTFK